MAVSGFAPFLHFHPLLYFDSPYPGTFLLPRPCVSIPTLVSDLSSNSRTWVSVFCGTLSSVKTTVLSVGAFSGVVQCSLVQSIESNWICSRGSALEGHCLSKALAPSCQEEVDSGLGVSMLSKPSNSSVGICEGMLWEKSNPELVATVALASPTYRALELPALDDILSNGSSPEKLPVPMLVDGDCSPEDPSSSEVESSELSSRSPLTFLLFRSCLRRSMTVYL